MCRFPNIPTRTNRSASFCGVRSPWSLPVNRGSSASAAPTRLPARFRTRRRPVPAAPAWWTSSRRFARTGKRLLGRKPSQGSGQRQNAELEEARVLAAVNRQRGARDEARGVASEEYDGGRQLIGPSVSTERNLPDAEGPDLTDTDAELRRLVLVLVDDAVGFEPSGENRIDSDLWRRLRRQRLSHGHHRRPQCVGKHEVVNRLMRRDGCQVDDGAAVITSKGGKRGS